ncbi:pyrimidine 5'-nucleotidase [Denitromonas halophila]|uniref:Pyrimidine 5'-nucleotidase n=1 Tax=Denitromonas halophila TaxID=1629404 RepID=A0A557R3D8_9RHOO|nr:pyrimidine 5'-nucleotidase [Denitromonas halophila]TVO59677.1 pyrimidine 5'-nucleotidase [Denitromonas halophila]
MSTTPVWLFDLDDTLHHASAHIFPHINRSMTDYIMQQLAVDEGQANALRNDYWRRYGATLLGLMRHHDTDPAHFLRETHRFDRLHNMVVFERALRHRLKRLPGRKIVFSNGPSAYAHAVLSVMGLRRSVDSVFAIEQMRLQPKPGHRAFRRLLVDHKLQASRCILVEDSLANLKAAKRLGMRTVWISRASGCPAYVDAKFSSVLALPRALSRLGFSSRATGA